MPELKLIKTQDEEFAGVIPVPATRWNRGVHLNSSGNNATTVCAKVLVGEHKQLQYQFKLGNMPDCCTAYLMSAPKCEVVKFNPNTDAEWGGRGTTRPTFNMLPYLPPDANKWTQAKWVRYANYSAANALAAMLMSTNYGNCSALDRADMDYHITRIGRHFGSLKKVFPKYYQGPSFVRKRESLRNEGELRIRTPPPREGTGITQSGVQAPVVVCATTHGTPPMPVRDGYGSTLHSLQFTLSTDGTTRQEFDFAKGVYTTPDEGKCDEMYIEMDAYFTSPEAKACLITGTWSHF